MPLNDLLILIAINHINHAPYFFTSSIVKSWQERPRSLKSIVEIHSRYSKKAVTLMQQHSKYYCDQHVPH